MTPIPEAPAALLRAVLGQQNAILSRLDEIGARLDKIESQGQEEPKATEYPPSDPRDLLSRTLAHLQAEERHLQAEDARAQADDSTATERMAVTIDWAYREPDGRPLPIPGQRVVRRQMPSVAPHLKWRSAKQTQEAIKIARSRRGASTVGEEGTA